MKERLMYVVLMWANMLWGLCWATRRHLLGLAWELDVLLPTRASQPKVDGDEDPLIAAGRALGGGQRESVIMRGERKG